MKPWELLDSVPVPGGSELLALYRRDREYSIRVDGLELMNSRVHGSEDALAELVCARLKGNQDPKILIGGLGMGFTLAATLQHLEELGRVEVAELVPAVVRWNLGPMAELCGDPLRDKRVTVREGDVAQLLRANSESYDGVMLDVDNGPDGFTRSANNWLYSRAGLQAAHSVLKPSGVFAVWSAGPDPVFSKRLRQSGFAVEEVTVRARGKKGGSRHMIWVATK